MDRKKIDKIMTVALKNVKGIVKAGPFSNDDCQKMLDIEQEAEKKAFMGLGNVVNAGVREVLTYEFIYVALTNMDFDWGCHASLVLKKDDQVVGEEVRDKNLIAELEQQQNVWFMHRNFVIYKDKVSFPKDIMQKVCYFEIPCIPADWCTIDEKVIRCSAVFYSNPSPLSDVFLKENYFKNIDDKGLGTILIGAEIMNQSNFDLSP